MRLFLRGLGPALILTCILAICCIIAGIAASKGAQRRTEPVKVALVDEEDSLLSRVGINMVTDQSYMSSLMEITQVDTADDAAEGISDGTYAAAIILPDGYMEDIMHGVNCTGRIYISDALEADGELVAAIADFGARLLTAGQLGVFAGERVIAQQGISEAVHSRFLEDTNARLITFALDAYDTVFSFEVLPYGDTGISMTAYYGACWLVLLLFVTGLFFPQLYTADGKGSIYSRLKTYGMSSFDYCAGKIIYPTLFRIVLCTVACLAVNSIGSIAGSGLLGKSGIAQSLGSMHAGFSTWLILVFISLFISIVTTGVALALCKKGGWAVTILAMSAVCLFMAGGLVPRTMLPEILPKLVVYTPFGAALSLTVSAMGGALSGFAQTGTAVLQAIIVMCAYAVLITIWAVSELHVLPQSNEEVRL